MSTRSSESKAILDVAFDNDQSLALSAVLSEADLSQTEDLEIDTDGLIYVKLNQSYAPIRLGERTSDLAWFDSSGELLDYQSSCTGTAFAKFPYQYVVESPVGELPQVDLRIEG